VTSDHKVAGSSAAGCSDSLPTTCARYGGNRSQRFMQSLCSFLVLFDNQRQLPHPRTRASTTRVRNCGDRRRTVRAVKTDISDLDLARFDGVPALLIPHELTREFRSCLDAVGNLCATVRNLLKPVDSRHTREGGIGTSRTLLRNEIALDPRNAFSCIAGSATRPTAEKFSSG
jgi:hypothetical protein